MVKSLKKRMAAAVLSAAMAFTPVFAADGLSVTQAASKNTPYVGLRTTFKTLQVRQTNKMTLKNNTIGWKITKIATEDRTIAMVYDKTVSDFMIKGKSAGRTKVKARLKTTARKKYNSKLVKCTVNVVSGGQQVPDETPVQPPAAETSKNVTTQAELDAALADANITELTIDTKEKQKFVIQAGDHSNVALTVKAPASDIENNAKFKSIDIQEIAGDTWNENAAGNTLRISASSARIVVGPGGAIRDISFTRTDANVKLVVNGTVENVTISARLSIDISSDLEQKPTVPLMIDAAAQGANVTAQTPLDVTVRAADTVLNFQKGAENSKVKAEVKTTVKNDSSASIPVTDAKNKTQKVSPGTSSIVNNDVPAYVPSPGGSSGSSTPSVNEIYYTVSFNGKEIQVRSGEKILERDIPAVPKRNGDGLRFSGWYYADGTDENGKIKYAKFDFNSVISRNIELFARYGITEEDRILDVRGKLYVVSGSAVIVSWPRPNATVAILDNDEAEASIVKINDQAVPNDSITEMLVQPVDGKLEVIIQLKDLSRYFRTEISLPEGAENGKEINLAECKWEYYPGNTITVSSQEELDAALADRTYNSVRVSTPAALKLTLNQENSRPDVALYVDVPGAEIENHAVFKTVAIQKEGCSWTEHAAGNNLHIIYGASHIIAAKDAEVSQVVFNWGGEGSLTVNGAVHNISLWNNREADDEKNINIEISGKSSANIPLSINRRDATVTTSVPLDVSIFNTAPHSTVNFMEGSGNSTVAAYVEAVINNNSGQEIMIKKTGN